MKIETLLMVIMLLYISSTIGIVIKLLSFNAERLTVFIAPFILIIAIVFNISFLIMVIKKISIRNIKDIFYLIVRDIKNFPLSVGILCTVLVKENVGIELLLYPILKCIRFTHTINTENKGKEIKKNYFTIEQKLINNEKMLVNL